LLKALRLGAAGCITASGNINAAAIRKLIDNWTSSEAEALQKPVAAVRDIFSSYPLIPAAKAILSTVLAEPGLASLRPPLTPLTDTQTSELLGRLKDAGHAFAPADFG
jgi:4-hydroxy-tetrahydrodipicolinate synthase